MLYGSGWNNYCKWGGILITPKLKWNGEEGDVKFPNGFDEQNWVLKADALKDWICELTDKYNSLFTEEERSRK